MKTLTLRIPDALDPEMEEKIKQELISYLDYLLVKEKDKEESQPKRIPKFGCAKGKFRMSADFDAPLDHFADYMPS